MLMWNPDDPERDEFAEELTKALLIDQAVRNHYGIKRNEDGSFGIADLTKIKAFPEDVKSILRDFLRAHKTSPYAIAAQNLRRSDMDEDIRIKSMVKSLYAKIDALNASRPQRLQGYEKKKG